MGTHSPAPSPSLTPRETSDAERLIFSRLSQVAIIGTQNIGAPATTVLAAQMLGRLSAMSEAAGATPSDIEAAIAHNIQAGRDAQIASNLKQRKGLN